MSLLLALLTNAATATITASVVLVAGAVGVVPSTAESSAQTSAEASVAGTVPSVGQIAGSPATTCEASCSVPCAGLCSGVVAPSGTVGAAIGCAGLCVGSVAPTAALSATAANSGAVAGVVSLVWFMRGRPPTVEFPLAVWVQVSTQTANVADQDVDSDVLIQPAFRRTSAWVDDKTTTAELESLLSYSYILDQTTTEKP